MSTVKRFRKKIDLHKNEITEKKSNLKKNQLNFMKIWLMIKMKMILSNN